LRRDASQRPFYFFVHTHAFRPAASLLQLRKKPDTNPKFFSKLSKKRPEIRRALQAPLLYCPAMLKQALEQGRAAADATLEQLLPPATQYPASIHQAMRHSVFAGGKRLRPILCMEAGRMIAGGSLPLGIEQVGAALEMLHTYSLIHDDLPALDNDDLRRGRPTCHKAFGEAIAILAGDALQTQAYEILSQLACAAQSRVAIIREIARATGTIDGMIGGQVVDLEAEHRKPDLATLEYIHRSKTAALITASVVSGGIYAAATPADLDHLRTYGQSIGLAFQIVDDVLDLTQTSEQLGKTAGKDAAAEKATYPALFGIEESLRRADTLVKQACQELNEYGSEASNLEDLAHFLIERKK
jgi:geranylgeranyl diphosphate synthase, type II